MNDLKHTRLVRSLAMMGLIGMAVLLPVFPADATNWQANIEPGSEIVMNDLRWPVWDQGTYYCFWYSSFVPKYTSFYGGVAVHGPDKTPGMFTSYWGVTETIHEGEEFYGKGFGAEGSKGGANGTPTFQRPNSWYRMVMRVFPPTRQADKKTNVGWWIKDVEKNRWYTHSVLRIPSVATGFAANSGFVEALAPETVHRAFERRLGYCRLNGKWYNSPLSANEPSNFKLIENDTVVRFDRPVKDNMGFKKPPIFFATKQPATPTLDKPAIEQAEAHTWGNQVSVKWKIPQSASPQLGYKLEAFTGSDAKGPPLATWEDASPHVLTKRLDTDAAAKTVRLTVTDIFDQQIAVVIPVKKITLPAPATDAARTRAGLRYDYYETPKNVTWKQLPDFATLKPVKQGCVKDLDDTVREDRRTGYAIRYTGYVRVPADGLYVVSEGTSDGSRMYIDGKLIADNDGIHSTSAKQYPIAITKGLRAFELEYFKGANTGSSSQGTTDKIIISWEGPGFELRRLTRDDFTCEDSADFPSIALALKGAVSDGVLEDNLAKIHARIERRGHPIEKSQLFAGKRLLATKPGVDVDDKDNVDFSVLLPEGNNRLWARLWFGEGNSIDSSNELELEAKNRTVEPWQFDSMEKGGFPLAVRCDADRASFMGEGFGFVHQTVSGDFTLTARIADIALTSEENGVWPANWMGLSILRKHENPKVLITSGGPYNAKISLFLTAGKGMKGMHDFPDLAGSYMSIASFEKDHRWLRLVRRGPRYQAFTSADGKTWQKADERLSSGFSKEVYAGLCFRSGPNKSRSLFQGVLDQIKLESGVPQEVREKPRKEDLRLENRVTAIVQAPKNPEILYARSPSKGLFRSEDRAETWKPVNGGLGDPDAMAVRSVAVHPENSSIVLRAGGSVVNGVLTSGLWRSTDGGKSWKLVTREIDFDGRGPTTLFGEVILFCPLDPDLVVAGGETKGLFISRDAGDTWTCVGLTGERITSMAFSPQPDKYTQAPTLVVGTFADCEFETLGLPKPVSQVEAPGRIYWMNLSAGMKASKPTTAFELEDFGVANMVFDTERNFVTFATTRGVYYTWIHGAVFSQRLHEMPTDEFFTAIGCGPYSTWSKFTCAAPFSGKEQSPVYFSQERSRNWSILSDNAPIEGGSKDLHLNAGISSVLPDCENENTLYLCNCHGVFKTTNRGRSYKLVKRVEN